MLESWRQAWQRCRGAGDVAVDDQRWVVLDVESSGLDMHRDRLLAIAAVAVHFTPPSPDGEPPARRPRIVLADSFEVVLRQPQAPAAPDKANILVHGIGVGQQRLGAAPELGLAAFVEYVGASPLLAFHSVFDQTLIGRALREVLGRELPNPWLDLAQLAPAVRDDIRARSLDEWMAALGIVCAVRHQAAADTLATAELLLKLWPRVLAQGDGRFATVRRLAARSRWLPQG